MKRLQRVDETIKDVGGQSLTAHIYTPNLGNLSTTVPLTTAVVAATAIATPTLTAYTNAGVVVGGGGNNNNAATTNNSHTNHAVGGVKVVVSEGGGNMQSGLYPATPVNYGVMPAAAAPHPIKTQTIQSLTMGGQLRATGASPPTAPVQDMQQPPTNTNTSSQQQQQQQSSPGGDNFQRLKVEDALSYLDLVKYKFDAKPQVYNDFLDIMKEFKSQTIDTPGVIQRVSNLFRCFPDLIVGFNTFLPPGYKIEVQRSDQGYAFQVSVSVPSPTGGTMQSITPQQSKSEMILRGSGTMNMASGGSGGTTTMAVTAPTAVTGGGGTTTIPQFQPLALAQHGTPVPATPPAPPQQTVAAAAAAVVATTPTVPVVHHSSAYGSGAPSSYNNTLTLSAAQVAVSQALQGHTDTPQNQPVQFNHAINYVNKIKNRFQDQPEKYKRFLDILHIYQKEQRTLKESTSGVATGGAGGGAAGAGGGGGAAKHLTEQEVYSQVAKLFENQNDLLAEFGQFLPDATSHINNPTPPTNEHHPMAVKKPPTKQPPTTVYRENIIERHHLPHNKPATHVPSGQLKRSPPYPSLMHRDAPPPKKHKVATSCRDVTLAEAGKVGTLNDYAFFDKVRKAMRTQEVYNNFLRCLTLFNQEIISKSELIMVVTPFLGKFPELLRWFREFLGQNDVEPIPYNVAVCNEQRPQGESSLEIDLATCKRLGASYCVIPKAQEGLSCSGRTQLCKEVLNDQWVSFPTWSEDSTFVSSRKTQYEEYMYRCEDERFELDVVIETNASTIRVLEGVHKKLNRMNADEVARYRLDDCLGGSSPTLHQRALKRIYGDKASDIIDGLKRNPAVAVPVVLRRLKAKEEEWREAQKGFNKIWREQNEKYYLKSLDHQGINFKQIDVKALRSKSLFNEIETIFDERHDQSEENGANDANLQGPHLVLPYKDRTILDDAANLLIHHVKRQTGIQKGEKRRIKHLLRQFLPELFFHPKQQLTDDEREDEDDKDDGDSSGSSPNSGAINTTKGNNSPGKSPGRNENESIEVKMETDSKDEDVKVPLHAQTGDPEEAYTLFMANNNWYIFLRLHAILCERLAKIYERAVILAAEETKSRTNRKDSTAVALRLKPKPQIEIEDYYPAFLDMVKNLLDGNMDANTYEDTLREMYGIHAYIAFTLDKVVSYAVRQLQHCVTERTAIACMDLFLKEQKRGASGGACSTAYRRAHVEMAYQRAGEKAVQDENCFKIYIYKKDCRMTIELLDTDTEDTKKVEEAKKWSTYKECYADCTRADNRKPRSPVYLNRNLKRNKRRLEAKLSNDKKTRNGQNEKRAGVSNDQADKDEAQQRRNDEKSYGGILEAFERKLNERPERNQPEHPGYDVSDETECKFNVQDFKINFTVNKDSYLYKMSAFSRARQTHPDVTKRLSSKFRGWLKKWACSNISDVQHKQCTDWLMGRGEGVVPNRTRVLTDNDLNRTPYVPYNRYRVERLVDDAT